MVSLSLTKAEIEKCINIQCNPAKWKGLLIGSLKKVTEQVHPSLKASDEALEYVEMLVIQCLEILTLRSSSPHTVQDIEDQVKRSFPKPIDKWAIRDAKEALEKNKKKNPLVLPTDKIHILIQKEILQYKLDYQVALYTTAVLEYIAADILKLAGNYVKNIHRVEIGFQDLRVALCGDKVLMDLFGQHDDNGDLNLSDLGIDKIQRTSTTYEEVIRDLMHDERQHIRDLHLILKIFKEEIDRIIPSGSSLELDSMFNNITDICKATGLFLSSIEDILEIAEDKSATVGCCIEELAEAAEFDVFARYANDIVKSQCRSVFWNLIGKPEVSNLLQSAGYGFKEAVKYYFPKLLLLPLWHCILYFEYIKILHQLSPSQLDKECLEQVEGMLKPLQLQMTAAANKVNLPDNVKEFGLKINATPRRLLAIEKLNEMQKAIDGWDGKDMGQCCTEFIREGVLIKVSSGGKRCSERKAILFDGVLILCKSNNRRTSVSVSSQLVGSMSEFKLKEKFFIRKVEIIDREDTEDTKHSFEIAPRLQPPIILVASSFQDKANWMADLVMLNTKSMLDRTLNSILLDEDKKFPLRLPSIDEYRFVEPDSRSNIIFEEKENNGVPLIKGATLVKLVERLTYHIYADPKFVRTFLTTYRSFCSPHELLDLLIERYNIPEPFGIKMDTISLRDESKRFKKEYLVPVQFRVLNVIRHWVDYHYYDYQRDPSLLDKLHIFLDSINGKSMKKWADSVVKILQRKNTESQKEITFAFNSPPPPVEVHMEFNVNEEFNILYVHPIEFARQLTLIESENYRAVKPSELVGSVWTKKDKELNSPHLLRLIKRTTNFSRWIEKAVVECENFEERVAIVSRFIEVMMALDELNNFNGVLGVLSAMSSAAVFRLKITFQAVNARLDKALEEARELSNNHFRKYQDKLRSINPPCVPFIGMYLTNILHIEEGNPDCLTNSPNLINFNKRRKVAEIIAEIQQYQNQPYCLNVEPKIKNFLENLNPFNDTKDTDISNYLYEKSLEIEPRNCKQLPKYPRKWPELNLKSPGLKTKIRIPSASSKDLDVQGRRKLSSSSSLVIQMDKREADDSVFAPISFTNSKHFNDVPPVPPRHTKLDTSFKPPIPPRRMAPPLPPRRSQIEQILTPKKLIVDVPKFEISQKVNITKQTSSNGPNKKVIELQVRPTDILKRDSIIERPGGPPVLRSDIIQCSKYPFKPFILKRTAPSMFQFNV
ncbi:protein son of sevenless-like [Daktulosphaira vitifoliae]|uniref:protein son of sevenless-like n=1 Tax=Daktulosphaira vitifoliae TaxID=58002 RepID=UPI0021A998C0|nr:protein son of sevenless-like [Daktulosphaira vitifoliae]